MPGRRLGWFVKYALCIFRLCSVRSERDAPVHRHWSMMRTVPVVPCLIASREYAAGTEDRATIRS